MNSNKNILKLKELIKISDPIDSLTYPTFFFLFFNLYQNPEKTEYILIPVIWFLLISAKNLFIKIRDKDYLRLQYLSEPEVMITYSYFIIIAMIFSITVSGFTLAITGIYSYLIYLGFRKPCATCLYTCLMKVILSSIPFIYVFYFYGELNPPVLALFIIMIIIILMSENPKRHNLLLISIPAFIFFSVFIFTQNIFNIETTVLLFGTVNISLSYIYINVRKNKFAINNYYKLVLRLDLLIILIAVFLGTK